MRKDELCTESAAVYRGYCGRPQNKRILSKIFFYVFNKIKTLCCNTHRKLQNAIKVVYCNTRHTRKFPLNNSDSVKPITEHFGAASCFLNYQCAIIISYFDMKF